jgi:hypothetical protein
MMALESDAPSRYGLMAVAAFAVIVAGKMLLPFPGQQRAQNVSLAIEAVVGAALGLAGSRLREGRQRAK